MTKTRILTRTVLGLAAGAMAVLAVAGTVGEPGDDTHWGLARTTADTHWGRTAQPSDDTHWGVTGETPALGA
ncbi:hypothetical protein [Kitasatospora sp. NPDC017646]|uniref:hypothetical protein n=1 Tax=Kitasatospora sp. NPDC017646 TaxID=3364024 RepID=UPI0037B81605